MLTHDHDENSLLLGDRIPLLVIFIFPTLCRSTLYAWAFCLLGTTTWWTRRQLTHEYDTLETIDRSAAPGLVVVVRVVPLMMMFRLVRWVVRGSAATWSVGRRHSTENLLLPVTTRWFYSFAVFFHLIALFLVLQLLRFLDCSAHLRKRFHFQFILPFPLSSRLLHQKAARYTCTQKAHQYSKQYKSTQKYVQATKFNIQRI